MKYVFSSFILVSTFSISTSIHAQSEQGDDVRKAQSSSANVVRKEENSGPLDFYKLNHAIIGSLQNADGAPPFSGDRADIKLQFSFKYRLFNWQALEPLHFGYTQTSWWDVGKESEPFAEHNFNPELFWEFNDISIFGKTLRSRAGLEHNSNGTDGDKNRSVNDIYGQGTLHLSNNFTVSLKLWGYISVADSNADYRNYIGNSELSITTKFSNFSAFKLSTTKGYNNNKYNFEASLTFFSPRILNVDLYFSYYDGYAESLVSYNIKTKSLRGGFSIPL